MKYFTKKLWADFNNFEKNNVSEAASKQWDINIKKYWSYIDHIKPELTKKAQCFFSKISLHDGTLLSFSIGDVLQKRSPGYQPKRNFAEIRVLHAGGKYVYILKYSKIRLCTLDYPSNSTLFLDENWTFNDWGYDELFLTDDKWLNHSILFASGATICVEFKHFNYTREDFEH